MKGTDINLEFVKKHTIFEVGKDQIYFLMLSLEDKMVKNAGFDTKCNQIIKKLSDLIGIIQSDNKI